MKIAIVTVYDSIINYGSFLQAYALMKVLEEMGNQVYFVRRMEDDMIADRFNKINKNHTKKRNKVKQILSDLKRQAMVYREEKANVKRLNCSKDDWKNINIINPDDLEKIGIDLVICGSDEIWNLHNKDVDFDFYGCGWVHNIPKIAYAISSGDTKTLELISASGAKEQIGEFSCILSRDEMTQQLVQDITGEESTIVCDPTILLGKQNYALSDIGSRLGRYMLVYSYYLTKQETSFVKRYAKENNLRIVSPCIYSPIANEVIYTPALDFPALIAGAECVYTTTFHGTIFSLMFSKRFCCIPKKPKIANLLEQVGGSRYALKKNASYETFKEILDQEVERDELDSSLERLSMDSKDILKNVLLNTMEKGHCPIGVKYKDSRKYYFGYSMDDKQVRSQSSSGGMFYELAQSILDQGGVVFGAVNDRKDGVVKHCSTEEVSILEMRKSKYVESLLGDTFLKIEKCLKEGRLVLFCGTPCQAAALAQLRDQKFRAWKKQLYILDFLCEGVPSRDVYAQYLSGIEKKTGKNISAVDFRSKAYGWNLHCMEIKFSDGTELIRPYFADSYMHTFIMDLAMNRPACYHCRFRINKRSDITIGDFWKIQKVDPQCNDNKGVSAIIVNSENGQALLDSVESQIRLERLPDQYIGDMQQLLDTSEQIVLRNKFYDEFIKNGYEEAIKKYSSYIKNKKLSEQIKLLKFWCELERKRKKDAKQCAEKGEKHG